MKAKQKINTVDNKAFLDNIFKDEEATRDVRMAKITTILDKLENQLRDSIESQPNLLAVGSERAIIEISRDFANKATIEFTDKFIDDTPETFNRDEADAENARLIQKYKMSQKQQTLAVFAREFTQAENAKVQQESIRKTVTTLQQEGKIDEAKELMEEAALLGIPVDGTNINSKEKPKKGGKLEKIKNILNLAIENIR